MSKATIQALNTRTANDYIRGFMRECGQLSLDMGCNLSLTRRILGGNTIYELSYWCKTSTGILLLFNPKTCTVDYAPYGRNYCLHGTARPRDYYIQRMRDTGLMEKLITFTGLPPKNWDAADSRAWNNIMCHVRYVKYGEL